VVHVAPAGDRTEVGLRFVDPPAGVADRIGRYVTRLVEG
jgi:hypothetical protein